MKAAFLTGLRSMEIRDVPEPEISGPADVLLAVDTVGVCGSDMHYYKAGRIGCQIVEFPWIIGHECAARVLDVGAEVAGLEPGDRVAVDPLVWCHTCDQCRYDSVHTCRNQAFLGCPQQLPGCMCERLVMPEASCFVIPEGMSSTRATLAEPFSIALWARKLAGARNGAKVGVLGSGPIGLCVLAAVKEAVDCTVYQTDLLANRMAAAEGLGAAWTGSPDETDIVADITAAEPDGLDVVFECVGSQETLDQSLELLKPRGRIVIVGISEDSRLTFEMNHMRRKELVVQNVRRQLHCVREAIEMLATEQVNIDSLITHEFTFEQTQEAYDLVADYRDDVIKAMIHINADR